MGKNSTNDRVYSLVWCPDDDEDVSKRSSTPNYLQFGPNWVQIGHRSQEIEKLESFEEDGKNSTNNLVWSLVWCQEDNEDVLKCSSNLNYMDSSQDLVKIRHMSPDMIGN